MTEKYKLAELKVGGMTCQGCERIITKGLLLLPGVTVKNVSAQKGVVKLLYDEEQVSLAQIQSQLVKLGYYVITENEKVSKLQLAALGIALLILYLTIQNTIGFNFIPEIDSTTSFGMLFVIGLLTSLHCLAMCGGINLSQSIEDKNISLANNWSRSIFYNLGRVISYTLIGGVVGSLGKVISFTGTAKGMVAIIAGIFMVFMALRLLNILPGLGKIGFKLPGINIIKHGGSYFKRGSFVVGLANGLMPCGPLQTMQLYALSQGSLWTGAASMFAFSLGTVPLMLGLGATASYLGGKATRKMVQASGLLVLFLGFIMVGRGLNLAGVSIFNSPFSGNNVAQAKILNGIQVVETQLEPGEYQPISVYKGVPLRWIINADERDLNGCNNPLIIPTYNLEVELKPGKNIIEFTPREEGTIRFTCWMGMIGSTITVIPRN